MPIENPPAGDAVSAADLAGALYDHVVATIHVLPAPQKVAVLRILADSLANRYPAYAPQLLPGR